MSAVQRQRVIPLIQHFIAGGGLHRGNAAEFGFRDPAKAVTRFELRGLKFRISNALQSHGGAAPIATPTYFLRPESREAAGKYLRAIGGSTQ